MFTPFEREAALWNYSLFFWGEDAVADTDGTPSTDKPSAVMRIALSELAGGGTQMVLTVAWASDEGMEWMLATGTDAGMIAAVGQIDELLGLPARA